MGRIAELRENWRPAAITGGEPFYPLGVLFGLNAVDELDRTAYAILLPEIRDHFELTNAQILGTVAAAIIVILAVEIPLAQYADRANRVKIATVGALTWAFFSAGTGIAITVGMLIAMRIGAGIGRSVVTPTHNSLLSDYYAPEHRVKVFSFHRLANSTGAMIGPISAGAIAHYYGWRVPFFVLAIPTLLLIGFAARMQEPKRGAHEQGEGVEPIPFRSAFRLMAGIPTLRRVWMAIPFLAVALVGIPSILSLIYEDVFGVSEFQRGLIAAAAEPAQIVGVIVAMPFASRLVNRDPAQLLRFIAVTGVLNGGLVALLGFAPNIGVAVLVHFVLAATVGILAPTVFAFLSLIIPSHVRSLGFTVISVFGIPGVAIVLPLIGYVGDEYGLRFSTLMLVPVTVAAGLILASSGKTAAADIAANQRAGEASAGDLFAAAAEDADDFA